MTTRLQRRTIVLTTALTLLLGACSSASTPAPAVATSGAPTAATDQPSVPPAVGSTGAATGGTGDPCSLLTQAEVDTAAGQSLGPGAKAGALDDCQWSTSDFSASVEQAPNR